MLLRHGALAPFLRCPAAQLQSRTARYSLPTSMYESSLHHKRERAMAVHERTAKVQKEDLRGQDRVESLQAVQILQNSLARQKVEATAATPSDSSRASTSDSRAASPEVAQLSKDIEALDTKPIEAYVVLQRQAERRQSSVLYPTELALSFSKLPERTKGTYEAPLVQIRASGGDRIVGYGLWKHAKQQVFVLIWTGNPRDSGGPRAPKLRNLDTLGIGRRFWFHKFYAALEYRQTIIDFEECNTFTLLNGSADNTPGLHCDLFANCATITLLDTVAVHILPYLLEFLLTRTPITVIHIACRTNSMAKRIPMKFQGYYPRSPQGRGRIVSTEGMIINLDVTDRARLFQPSKRLFRGAIAAYTKDRKVCTLGDRNGSNTIAALLGGAERVFCLVDENERHESLEVIQKNIEKNFFTDELVARDERANRGFAHFMPDLMKRLAYDGGKLSRFLLKVEHGVFDCIVLDLQGSNAAFEEADTVEYFLTHAIQKVDRASKRGGMIVFVSMFDLFENVKIIQKAAQRTRCDVRMVEPIYPAPDAAKALQSDSRPQFTGWVLNVREL